MSSDGTVYEVELGPSTIELMFSQLFTTSYSDPPMVALLVFDVVWFGIFFRYRHSLVVATIQFLISCYLIFITESVNDFCALRWRTLLFSRDYFDESCIFLAVYYGLPVSIVAGLITLNLFIDLCKSLTVHRYFKSILPDESRTNVSAPSSTKAKQE
jgi:hypothetical protein